MTSNDSALTPRILVVDDNLSIHEDFKKILSGNNSKDRTFDDLEASLFGQREQTIAAPAYRLDFASQGQEALAMLEQAEKEEALLAGLCRRSYAPRLGRHRNDTPPVAGQPRTAGGVMYGLRRLLLG